MGTNGNRLPSSDQHDGAAEDDVLVSRVTRFIRHS
jgi:hypothetical protein